MDRYSNFMKQIPNEIMQGVEKHMCNNVALFKPSTYVAGITMYSDDYHIIIPSTPPPETYINNSLKTVERGKIITINPGESIYVEKEQRTEQYLTLLIKPEFMNNIAKEMNLSDNIKFLKLQNPFSKELLQAINSFDHETQRSENFQLLLDCLSTQIVILLLREFKTNSNFKKIYLPDSDTCISVAIDFMETFYSSNITIDDICKEINLSKYHFIRIFKQKKGLSPHQYLLKIRIKKAEELLRSREFSITEVAALCGFISAPHFSNTFKLMTGHSPSEYRTFFLI